MIVDVAVEETGDGDLRCHLYYQDGHSLTLVGSEARAYLRSRRLS